MAAAWAQCSTCETGETGETAESQRFERIDSNKILPVFVLLALPTFLPSVISRSATGQFMYLALRSNYD